MSKALVIFSGGLDSTVCLYYANQEYEEVHAISFDYGQRHIIELESAKTIAKKACVSSHEIVDVKNILKSSSPLLSKETSLETYENIDQMNTITGKRQELTFVPMRNALFLTIAANRAETLGGADIITGVVDGANFDDTREVFIKATEDYINKALGHDHRGTTPINIVAPLLFLSKAETAKLALTLTSCWDALAYSHTSYDGVYPPTDNNRSNVLRAQGFFEAGYPDPLVVRAWFENLMSLPATSNYDILRKESYNIKTLDDALEISQMQSKVN